MNGGAWLRVDGQRVDVPYGELCARTRALCA
jgi:hypothetical protein